MLKTSTSRFYVNNILYVQYSTIRLSVLECSKFLGPDELSVVF